MTRRPDPIPSPQARRQAHQRALLEALAQRDALGVERLLGQWVHRHGHPALAPVLVELQAMDPEGMAWWQGGVDRALDPGVEPVVEPVSQQLPPPPAPQAYPDLARLRSWLPDRVERRRAA